MDKIQQAKAILREAGYFVDNLWHVDDVKSRYEGCDDATAQEILDNALTNDGTMSQIWFAIDFAIDEIKNGEEEDRLYDTDYVIYDKANDHVVQFNDGSIVIFGDYDEAMRDCRGNESVVRCTELPISWQIKIQNQIRESK